MRGLTIATTVIVAAALLIAAGCGSDSNDEPSASDSNKPARGYNIRDNLIQQCRDRGGALNIKTQPLPTCVLDTGANCKDGKLVGGGALPCVVDPALKKDVERDLERLEDDRRAQECFDEGGIYDKSQPPGERCRYDHY